MVAAALIGIQMRPLDPRADQSPVAATAANTWPLLVPQRPKRRVCLPAVAREASISPDAAAIDSHLRPRTGHGAALKPEAPSQHHRIKHHPVPSSWPWIYPCLISICISELIVCVFVCLRVCWLILFQARYSC